MGLFGQYYGLMQTSGLGHEKDIASLASLAPPSHLLSFSYHYDLSVLKSQLIYSEEYHILKYRFDVKASFVPIITVKIICLKEEKYYREQL